MSGAESRRSRVSTPFCASPSRRKTAPLLALSSRWMSLSATGGSGQGVCQGGRRAAWRLQCSGPAARCIAAPGRPPAGKAAPLLLEEDRLGGEECRLPLEEREEGLEGEPFLLGEGLRCPAEEEGCPFFRRSCCGGASDDEAQPMAAGLPGERWGRAGEPPNYCIRDLSSALQHPSAAAAQVR